MRFVACSGFPIPVSRYLREFPAVEISDSELGLPGEGTVRRWKREAPGEYGFSIVAPRSFVDANFAKASVTKELVAGLVGLASDLEARALVISGPDDLKHGKAIKDTLRTFVKALPTKLPPLVFDLPAWKSDQIASIDDRVIPAYDPLRDDAPSRTDLAYIRLPGPAGHRSRYDEAAIERLLEHLETVQTETAFCVFRNIDMHANAAAVLKKWK